MKRAFLWVYENLLEWTVGALLFVIVLLSIAQVFNRYVLGSPLTWTEEFARLLLVWAVALGAAAGIKRSGHLKIDFLYLRTRGLTRRAITLVDHVIVLGVAIGMCWFGYKFYASTGGDYSTSLGYARNMVYLPIPVAGVLVAMLTVVRAWLDWSGGADAASDAPVEPIE